MAIFEYSASHVFYPGSDPVEDATALRAMLLASVAVDLEYLRRHSTPLLYESGVVYGRTKQWLAISDILAARKADCKSLAPWRIAEMIHYKICTDPKPVFRWDPRPGTVRPNGDCIKDYHVLIDIRPCKTKWSSPQGHECPSRILGMGKSSSAFATVHGESSKNRPLIATATPGVAW